MAYEQNSAGMTQPIAGISAGGQAREQRPLESLPFAVNRVNSAVVSISNFIDRFHGQSPAESVSPSPHADVAQAPYATTLEHLFAALDRLETRVESLDRIG